MSTRTDAWFLVKTLNSELQRALMQSILQDPFQGIIHYESTRSFSSQPPLSLAFPAGDSIYTPFTSSDTDTTVYYESNCNAAKMLHITKAKINDAQS